MINLICRKCNSEFSVIPSRESTAHFCSRNCYDTRNGAPVKYNCLNCQKEFFHPPALPRRYCSHSCANKGRVEKTLEPKYPNSFRKFWMRRGIIKNCEKCGYDECKDILGIHHIDENRKNNKRENLMVLCPNCHSLIHRKHIPH